MFHRLDVYLKIPRDQETLYSSLGVKLHGFLFSHIPQKTAARFHSQELVPFTSFLCEGDEGVSLYRICALHPEAECILALLRTQQHISISGLPQPLEVAAVKEYPMLEIESLQSLPPLTEFELILASPATYRKGGKYCGWFELRSLLRTTAQKLERFEGVSIDQRTIDAFCAQIELVRYRFESSRYVLAGQSIPCMRGGACMLLSSVSPLSDKASLLLRYAEYAGIGAKTPMGMGGMLLNVPETSSQQ